MKEPVSYFAIKMFTDIVKTTLLFCTGVLLRETHVYTEIMANHYYDKAIANQDSRYCDIKSHVCDPIGISLIQTWKNISDRKACQRLCDTERKCMFTTFTFFREEPRCFILSNCDRQVNCYERRNEHDINFISFRFHCVPLSSPASLPKDFVPLRRRKMLENLVKCCHHQDSLIMWHFGLAKEDWIPTETSFLMPHPALPCRILIFFLLTLVLFLRCYGSNVDSGLKIYSSECRNSKWTRPAPLNRLNILEDNQGLLVPLFDTLIHFQCKDRIPNAMTAKLLCQKLEDKAKLTFLQQLFMKYSCK